MEEVYLERYKLGEPIVQGSELNIRIATGICDKTANNQSRLYYRLKIEGKLLCGQHKCFTGYSRHKFLKVFINKSTLDVFPLPLKLTCDLFVDGEGMAKVAISQKTKKNRIKRAKWRAKRASRKERETVLGNLGNCFLKLNDGHQWPETNRS